MLVHVLEIMTGSSTTVTMLDEYRSPRSSSTLDAMRLLDHRSFLIVSSIIVTWSGLSCGGHRSAGVNAPTAGSVSDGEAPPLGRLPSDLRPRSYSLTLELNPARERFSGAVEIKVQLERPRSTIWIHGRDLDVQEVTVQPQGGERLAATWEQVAPSGVAAIRVAEPVPAGEAVIRIAYETSYNQQLSGIYRVEVGGQWYVFSQFEPIDARLAFPCFDEPSFKARFDTTLIVPNEHVAISNTGQLDQESLPDGTKRVRFRTSEPLPTYLLAFAVGPFDVVEGPTIAPNGVRSRALPFRGIATRGRGPDLAYAMEHTGRLLQALEEYFGTPFPFDKLDVIAVPDFGAGAMENAGAITFRESLLLLDPQSASEGQRRAFVGVTTHELSHSWFGDLVTLDWWDDLWLNEAMATWLTGKIVAETNPEFHMDLQRLRGVHWAMSNDELANARQIRQPIESTHDIHNAFDAITYHKGAAVLAMIERWLGPTIFRQGVRGYIERHRWGTTTADDFVTALSTAAGRDVGGPLRSFLLQPGVPLVEVSLDCEEGRRQLLLHQSRYLPVGSEGDREATWSIPLCVRYGSDDDARESCTVLDEEEGRLELEGERCPEWVMPNDGAAGYYRWSLPGRAMVDLVEQGALSPSERLSTAENLIASYRSADRPIAEVLAAFPALAADEHRLVATSPMPVVRYARDWLVDDSERPAVERFARDLYAQRAQGMSWDAGSNEDGEALLLRQQVLEFMSLVGRDAEIRRAAVERAHQLIGFGGDGQLRRSALAPELVGVALTVAVEEDDGEFLDALLSHLDGLEDASLRSQILVAAGSTRDPLLAERVRELVWDERLRSNEVLLPIVGLLYSRETREATWSWLEENFDRLATRIPQNAVGRVPRLGSVFCSDERAEQIEAFFAPRVQELEGAPRNLRLTLEQVHLCAALVRAQHDSARAFFAQYAQQNP